MSWIGHEPNLTVNQIRGAMGRGPGGWFFDNFSVTTPRSAYVLGGRIDNSKKPTEIDLQVRAARFAFQEWSGILRGLKNIAVESSFDTSLKGPVNRLATTLRLDENILEQFPEGYRHLAYMQTSIGFTVKRDMPGLTGPAVEALYQRGRHWLSGLPANAQVTT